MTPRPRFPSTAEKMRAIRARCAAAPAGVAKARAEGHLQAAEAAQRRGWEGECNRRLDSAAHALGPGCQCSSGPS
ncbi:hypothetical protein FBT96_17270 [Rhodobacter capsulatus]|uniref:Uncharacterized protein n=1 Tax=Rhodobacter capsulatus TaxID=1061 RepID=A0A4U1JNT0_RHOCA|nr:hypothetical protein [Rhodobacter capsulatus]TKD15371.1 hypothetical protein FBT96_17270 [Rhodobacter capsulatus]